MSCHSECFPRKAIFLKRRGKKEEEKKGGGVGRDTHTQCLSVFFVDAFYLVIAWGWEWGGGADCTNA